MLLHQETWMNIRAFKNLRQGGSSLAAIARETGCDWRTVRKYLAEDATTPPAVTARTHPPKVIEPYRAVIDGWLAQEPSLAGTVIYERLVADYGFSNSYQRVKLYLQEARPRVCPHREELHRRFEVLPGAQAQVDWGDEGYAGPERAYSFHMTLSNSRDPFTCFVPSQDLASFWGCHVRAFRHFGGVPAEILYDRTKTVVKRHVGRDMAVPLHPEALAFAAHYGFALRVAAPYRPQTKGRVERQVRIVREHVLKGRDFDSLAAMDEAFMQWLPIRRAQVHRTHGAVIAVKALADRAALAALPEFDYRVAERHLRSVAKDCLVSFESSLYSVPASSVRRPMRVELRVSADTVEIFCVGPDGGWLATHPRARSRGTWVITEGHWAGLPDGTRELGSPEPSALVAASHEEPQLIGTRSAHAGVLVHHRDLAFYDTVGVAS
jgi:transposase